MQSHRNSSPRDPRLVDTLIDDLSQPDLKHRLSRDYRELKDFMLDDEKSIRLASMGRLKGILFQSWWFVKGLLLRLSSLRRLLIALGIILIMFADTPELPVNHTHIFGGLCLLFVLMLELKDKVLARRELEAGRTIQESLMPERNPEVPGWQLWLFTRPANDVGGDLLDFLKVNGDRYVVSIGDVAGKGLSAALLTTKLQASIRALLPGDDGLRGMAEKLNTIFCRDSVSSMFASVICFEISPGSGSIRGVNAGHLPPIVFDELGVYQQSKGGAALGLIPDARFGEFSMILESGKTLLAYSDGVTEARNEAGEFYGEQRLHALLPSLAGQTLHVVGERLVSDIDAFRREAPAHDDITILLLRREETRSQVPAGVNAESF